MLPGLGKQEKSRSRISRKRLSGELFGLTRGCDRFRKEGVTVTFPGKIRTIANYFLRLGLSHLTVI
jgi:hypothetical protein